MESRLDGVVLEVLQLGSIGGAVHRLVTLVVLVAAAPGAGERASCLKPRASPHLESRILKHPTDTPRHCKEHAF